MEADGKLPVYPATEYLFDITTAAGFAQIRIEPTEWDLPAAVTVDDLGSPGSGRLVQDYFRYHGRGLRGEAVSLDRARPVDIYSALLTRADESLVDFEVQGFVPPEMLADDEEDPGGIVTESAWPPWVGFDLDGTLAKTAGAGAIGPPVKSMLARLRQHLAAGDTVKIFTARAAEPEQIPRVLEWLEGIGHGDLEITNEKDPGMIKLYDDRAVPVERDRGVMEAADWDFRAELAMANDIDKIGDIFRRLFGVPPSHNSPYFEDTLDSRKVKLTDLVAREAPDPERMETARARMRAAKGGVGAKRKPLTVFDMGNGKLKVLDGNTTLHALQELGETEAVVEVKKSLKQQVSDPGSIDEVYEQAAGAQPVFKAWAEAHAKATGGKLMLRPGLKGRARAEDKVANDYEGVAARLTDIVGGMIIFDTVEQVAAAYRRIVADPAVFKAKNRFEKPTPDGYMDVLLVVNVGGHLCELQLNTEAMLNAKEKGLGHKIYEVSRQLDPVAKDVEKNRDLAYIAAGYKEELRKVSVLYYRNAAMSAPNSSASKSASDSEISDELDMILQRLSESVISVHFSIDLPAIRKINPVDRSMAKATSSFSTNQKLALSDIPPPPFDGENITRYGKKIKAKVITGRPTRAYLSDDRKLHLQYAVVDAGDLVTSHTEGMGVNEEFPAELQPRDRTRDAMQLQVEQIATKLNPDRMGGSLQTSTGAPVVGPDLVVESGNGRTIALRKRFARDDAPQYRAWLEVNAVKFGIDKAALGDFERPVLVRIRRTEISRVDVAEKSNAGDMADMSPAEKALMDARRLPDTALDVLRPSDDGDLLNAGNRAFMEKFVALLGAQEATGLTTASGQATRQLADRAKAAIFHRAYGDADLLALVAEEANPDLKNVLAALTLGAKDFAKLKILPEAEAPAERLTKALVGAVNLVRRSRTGGQAIEETLAQSRLFESVPPDAKEIARYIDANVRRQARMGAVFGRMAAILRDYYLGQRQSKVEGPARGREPSVPELLNRAIKDSEPQKGLFESADAAPAVNFKTKKFVLQDRYQFQGMPISIENKAGSVRRGTDPDGHPWQTKMRFDYGYIRRTKGADDEGIDVYVGPDRNAPHAYIVKQHKIEAVKKWGGETCPECGEHVHDCCCKKFYDEDKVFLGFPNKRAAVEAYLKQYDSPFFLGPVSTMRVEDFRELVTGPGEKVKIPLQFVGEAAFVDEKGKFIMVGPGTAGNYAWYRRDTLTDRGRGQRVRIRKDSGIGDVPGIGGFFYNPAAAEAALADYAAKKGWRPVGKREAWDLAAGRGKVKAPDLPDPLFPTGDTGNRTGKGGHQEPAGRLAPGTRVYSLIKPSADPYDHESAEVALWGASRFGKDHDEEMEEAIHSHHKIGQDRLRATVEFVPETKKLKSAEEMLAHRIRNAKARVAKKDPLFYDEQIKKELSRPKFTIEACRADLAEKQKLENEFIARWWAKHPKSRQVRTPAEGQSKWVPTIRAASTVEEIEATFYRLGLLSFGDGSQLDEMGVRTRDAGDIKGVDAGIADTLAAINAAGFKTAQSMSGLKEDYEHAPDRYSNNGYIGFWKTDLKPGQAEQIEAAARKAGLAVETDADIYFMPAIEVRTGITKSGATLRELRKQASEIATAEIQAKYDDVKIKPIGPSTAFPSRTTGGHPTGKHFDEYLTRRDEIKRDLVEKAGGVIDDEEIKRRWKAFATALAVGTEKPEDEPDPPPPKQVGEIIRVGQIGEARVVAVERIEGVDYELFQAVEGDKGAFRIFDADSGEVVGMTVYPTFERAKAGYQEAVRQNGGHGAVGRHPKQVQASDLRALTSDKKPVLKDHGVRLYNSMRAARYALDAVGPRGADEGIGAYLLRIRSYQKSHPEDDYA